MSRLVYLRREIIMQWYELSLLIVFFGLAAVASYAWWDIRIRQRYVHRLRMVC